MHPRSHAALLSLPGAAVLASYGFIVALLLLL